MIRIGDFSRMSQTPVSTLRYYDEVGLLKPVEVDHFTGYRYYMFDQLARLHRILALKDLGFSLEEIARLLADDLPSRQVYEMVQRKRAELHEQVQDHHEQLERLDAWLKQIVKENKMSMYAIRKARIETDLPDIVRITNPYEDQPITVDQVSKWFQYNPAGRMQQRLVSVDENDAVSGYGGYVHEADATDHHFIVWVIVASEYRSQGTGSALWDALLKDLRERGATRLKSDVFDNDPQSLAFAEHRGFTIDQHYFNYKLDLTGFDEVPFLPDIAALAAQGIRFCALADFPDTSETRHKLYDLNTSYIQDNPEQTAPWTFPAFEEFVIGAAWFRREGQLLAVDGDEWIGMAPVSLYPEIHSAYNLHTGVLPAYRRRKIATSLKVLAARYARQNGALSLLTDSNLRNAPILAINRKMGYKPQPGKYMLVCELQEGK
jgi:DNA-binding transcriptional MerR regulator/GNAT superfamily N-acetyltransferase